MSRSFTAKRAVFLHRMGAVWDKEPNRRLGSLIHAAITAQGGALDTLETIDDDKLLVLLERYVLFGDERPSS
jgi:hypothetical protein